MARLPRRARPSRRARRAKEARRASPRRAAKSRPRVSPKRRAAPKRRPLARTKRRATAKGSRRAVSRASKRAAARPRSAEKRLPASKAARPRVPKPKGRGSQVQKRPPAKETRNPAVTRKRRLAKRLPARSRKGPRVPKSVLRDPPASRRQPPSTRPAPRRPGRARVSVFIGASVDGFIARENGDLDFLEVPGDPKGEDYGYRAFVGEIDAIVMGRKTFEKVLTFKGWPYAKTPVIVLTTRPLPVHSRLRGKVETMADRPAEIVGRLRRRGLKRLYLDGGRTIQGFLRAGVVDEITITRVPVLLGRGVPLFGALGDDVRLKHRETRAFRSGMVQTTYAVRRAKTKEPTEGRGDAEEEVRRRFGEGAPKTAEHKELPAASVEREAPSARSRVVDSQTDVPRRQGTGAPLPQTDPTSGQMSEDE